MQFLIRILEGRWLLYIGLATLAVGLPFSRALISIAPGILAGFWLFDGLFRRDFGLKFKRLKENKVALLFIGLFLLYVIGGLYSADGERAIKIITNKLPWLVFPLVIGSLKVLPHQAWKRILLLHIAAVAVSTLYSYFNLLSIGHLTDPKSAILFVNHIRLSLMLVLAVVLGLALSKDGRKYQLFLAVLFGSWALFFMSRFEIATGLGIALLLLLGLGLHAIRAQGARRWLGILFVLISIGFIAYVWKVGAQQLKKPSVEVMADGASKTQLGNPYFSLPDNDLTENGNYVWRFLALDEMRQAWNERSERVIDSRVEQDVLFEGGLIRYLTSKGLRKDAAGVAALSEEDIANIEQGHPSVAYSQFNGIRKRLYMLFYEVDAYRNGGDPSLSSMTIKWEYWRTGLELIRQHPIFGVGTGDVRRAFEDLQAQEGRISADSYDKAHNQYITWGVTFGIVGGCFALCAFVAPLFMKRSHQYKLLRALIYGVFLISFFTEDTLENQFGLNLFLFYAMHFIIAPPQEAPDTSK